MKRFLCSLAVLWLCVSPLAASDSNRIILRVNDRIATLYDYEFRRNERLRAIQAADLDPERRAELVSSLGAEVLSNMLDELLVLSRADQIGYSPTPGEIAEAVARAKENFGIQDDEQFQRALASSGMTPEAFEKQVTLNLRVSQVMGREVQQRVQLDEEDLRRYYYENPDQFTTAERVRVQEIVVLDTSSLTADERLELAGELASAVEAGASLADLAAEYRTEGTTSGMVDLGWIEAGDLAPDLEAAVWDLEAGAVSEPVDGRGGLHLLQVQEREESVLLEFADVADQIDARERNRLLMEEYDEYLDELRDAAYIRVAHLPSDVQGFNIQESASRLTLETDRVGPAPQDPDDLLFTGTDAAIDPEAAILDPDPDDGP